MTETRILGILITDRIKEAGRTQEVLSQHSRIIRSRLGFHELSAEKNSRTGIILIHLTGKADEWDKLEQDLKNIGGLDVKRMNFFH